MIVAVFTSVGATYVGSTASVSRYETDPPGASGADVVHVNVTAEVTQSGSSVVPVVPAGIVSETTTPTGSVEGPLFVTVTV